MTGTGQRRGIDLSRRAHDGLSASVDRSTNSVPLVITTEHPVRTWIPNPAVVTMTAAEIEASDISWIEVDEVLLTTGMDYSRTFRMPLLDNHNTHSGIDSILGRVDNIRAEGGKIIGVGVFSDRHSWLVAEIERGFFGQISAGYCVHEYEIIEREHDVPLAIAVRWTLHETSVVPVGADPNATVRGERSFPLPSFRKRAADPNTQEKKWNSKNS